MFRCRRRRDFDRRCQAIIESLPIRFPFELGAFLADVGKQRGVPIELWRMTPQRPDRTGMMVRACQRVYVFVASRTDPLHVSHIAFHELGHLLLGHASNRECTAPGRGPGGTHEVEEDHAERFAHLLSARVRDGAWRDRARMSRQQLELRAAFGSRRYLCGGYA